MILGRSGIITSAFVISTAVTWPQHRYHPGDWANELTLYIDVQSVTGTGSLVMTTIYGVIPHTTGNQYLTERLFALDTVQRVNLTAEAEDWPNPLCTNASSFPLTLQRTYIGFGKDLRFLFTPTGGATFTTTLVIHAKG